MATPDIEESLITFTRSKKTATWKSSEFIPLLKLAENAGLKPDYGCRSGACGTCETKLLKGSCAFLGDRSESAPEGDYGGILICSSVPASKEIELDL